MYVCSRHMGLPIGSTNPRDSFYQNSRCSSSSSDTHPYRIFLLIFFHEKKIRMNEKMCKHAPLTTDPAWQNGRINATHSHFLFNTRLCASAVNGCMSTQKPTICYFYSQPFSSFRLLYIAVPRVAKWLRTKKISISYPSIIWRWILLVRKKKTHNSQ